MAILGDDGDLIRGLGFVALYAAYVEEAVDNCLEHFVEVGRVEGKARRRSTSQKIETLQAELKKESALPEELNGLADLLGHVGELLERRNVFIHGRVYATVDGDKIRRSGRPGEPQQEATSAELYELANQLFETLAGLNAAWVFRLGRHLGTGTKDPHQ
ncbi:hypothetical protein [Paraburkholderia youngii]|uniref:hypothetical protein n=1 Tax=Paraburkholderia youngii TaxID=2782701 RepID=UPI003D2553EF